MRPPDARQSATTTRRMMTRFAAAARPSGRLGRCNCIFQRSFGHQPRQRHNAGAATQIGQPSSWLRTSPHGNATSTQRTARRSATRLDAWRKVRRDYTATNGGVTTMLECRGIVEELLLEGTSKAVTSRHRLVHQNCICKLSEQRRDSMDCKLISLQPECIRRKPFAYKVLPTTFCVRSASTRTIFLRYMRSAMRPCHQPA